MQFYNCLRVENKSTHFSSYIIEKVVKFTQFYLKMINISLCIIV